MEIKTVDATQLDADLKTVADSIRSKCGTTEQLVFPSGFKSAVENIETGITPTGAIEITENGTYDVADYASANVNVKSGGEDYLQYASSVTFKDLNVFGKSEIEITLNNPITIAGALSTNVLNTTVEKITLNVLTPVTAATSVFYSVKTDSTLKHIVFNVDVSKIPNFASCFLNLKALEIIDGTPFDLSGITTVSSNTFDQCLALREVRFKANTVKSNMSFQYSPLLSAESIQSIIDGLATVETAQTITLHADVKAKLTEEQLTTITCKNWTLA